MSVEGGPPQENTITPKWWEKSGWNKFGILLGSLLMYLGLTQFTPISDALIPKAMAAFLSLNHPAVYIASFITGVMFWLACTVMLAMTRNQIAEIKNNEARVEEYIKKGIRNPGTATIFALGMVAAPICLAGYFSGGVSSPWALEFYLDMLFVVAAGVWLWYRGTVGDKPGFLMEMFFGEGNASHSHNVRNTEETWRPLYQARLPRTKDKDATLSSKSSRLSSTPVSASLIAHGSSAIHTSTDTPPSAGSPPPSSAPSAAFSPDSRDK